MEAAGEDKHTQKTKKEKKIVLWNEITMHQTRMRGEKKIVHIQKKKKRQKKWWKDIKAL